MSSVDDRIVNMQFNNKQFTQGAAESQKSLEGLERTLSNTAKSQGLSEMGKAVDGVAGKFSAMRIAGITAIATVAQKATDAGLRLAKSLTIDPILDGFREYQTNLNSIQVIMANTGAKVNVVNKYLANLNHYSDQTIYNFGQMASAIGKFTAAGVSLPKATDAIKGMANAAALSGADANQLNSAMYQMSQALASGTIKLMDWNSLVNANMGGKNIQNALMATAKSLGPVGDAMDAAVKKQGTFRDSLTEGWLTSKVFTKTMKVMAGTTDEATGKTIAFSEAQLVNMGYTQKQAKELHRLSQASIDAATKIKTFPQMMDVVKESIGSGFAKIFQDLFGNFNESTALWTKVGTTITGTVGRIFESVDNVLVGWRELGGYKDLWEGFGNIFQAIGNILRPFVTAFKAIFPETGKAGSGLASVTSGFKDVTAAIEFATRGVDILTPVLVKMAEVIKFVFQQIGNLIDAGKKLAPVFQAIGSAASDMIAKGAEIGQGLVDGIVKGLNIDALQAAIVNLAEGIITWIKGALGIASPAAELVPVGLSIAEGIAKGISNGIKVIGAAIGKVVSSIGEVFKTLFSGMDSMDISALMNSLFAGGLILTIRNFTKGLKDSFLGIGTSIKDTFGQLTSTLKTMQQSIKAKIIRDIAIAVGILTVSVIALTFVDPKKLAVSLGAIATMLGTLVGALYGLGKVNSEINMAVLAASILMISLAMLNLAAAVTIFGQQDPKAIAQGLGAMAVALGILVGAMLGFSKIKGSIAGMAGSMLVISIAMNLLAAAVLAFGLMDVKTLAKGLGAMAIGLGLLVGAMLGMDMIKGSVEGLAASILIISGAMIVMATAVAMFGNMDMGTLAKGLGSVAVSLGLMVGALLILSAVAPGAIAGAGAMATMAASMILMATAVGMFGNMDLTTLAIGFGAVAVGLALLLLAAAGAQVVAFGLIVLSNTMLALGAGLMLAGLGMALFGAGFAVLAATGMAGVAVLTAAFESFIALLPTIAQQLAAAFVAFFKVLANSSDKLRESFGTIFKNILGVIQDNIPAIGSLLQELISTGIGILRKSIPQWVEMGFTVIDEFLKSAAKHVPSIAESAMKLITRFVTVIGNNLGPLLDAGAKLIVKFVQGLADAINNNVDDLRAAGLDLAMAIINGMTGGLLGAGLDAIQSAVNTLMDHIPGWAKKAIGANSPAKKMIPVGHDIAHGVALGITKAQTSAVAAVMAMSDAIIAQGSKDILRAQRAATAAQSTAYRAQADADIKDKSAKAAEALSKKSPKNKALEKKAKQARTAADKAQATADARQATADRKKQAVADVKRFEEADLHGKGDFRRDQAVGAADRANMLLQKANAEAAQAAAIMKTNKKAGRAMLVQSQKDAAAARAAAAQAAEFNRQANEFYSQEVTARIGDINARIAADAKARKDAADFEAADSAGKQAILNRLAGENEAKQATQNAEAQRLIALAQSIAGSNAAQAMIYLDQAEKAAEDAENAADQAKQQRDQAQQIADQEENKGVTGDTGVAQGPNGPSGPGIQPSRSALEDAAKIVDRYSASLAQATAAAATAQPTVQFVQNNHSPESLSTSEVYRQSKNLLSAAELKMGVPTNL